MKLGVSVSCGLFRRDFFLIGAKKCSGILALALLTTQAFADQFDMVNYIASAGVNFDDNVFRLPASADPQTLLGKPDKSDVTHFASFGLNVDKKYSNQELIFNMTGTNIKYKNFSNLDHTSSSIKGAWNWQIGSRLQGDVNAMRSQTLNNPVNTKVYTRNLNTIDNLNLNGKWGIDSRWHVLFGASDGHATNSINTVNNLGSHSSANELGLKYETATGKSFALISRNLRETNSNQVPYPAKLIDTGSTEKQLEFQANWNASAKSVVSGKLIDIHRQNYNFSQRDYSGTQGGINFTWEISGKTSLDLSLQRTLNSWWDDASSYYVADSVSISPKWQINSKTVMRIVINHGNNDYRGPVVPGSIARKDTARSVMLGIDWAPQRTITLSASLQHDNRSSTPASYSWFGFDDTTASLSAQVNF
jgi:exopolysaccharide biosynthesis operon protein EpsL